MGSAKQRLEDYYRRFPDGLQQGGLSRMEILPVTDVSGGRPDRPAVMDAVASDQNKTPAGK